MAHPQRIELETKLRKLIAGQPGDVLIVHEPETGAQVTFVQHHTSGALTPRARFSFAGTNSKAARAAGRLGFSGHRYSIHNPFQDVSNEILEFEPDVVSAEQGTDLCLSVLRDVYCVPDDQWLFITDIEEYDEWPDPLPKPEPWPPGKG